MQSGSLALLLLPVDLSGAQNLKWSYCFSVKRGRVKGRNASLPAGMITACLWPVRAWGEGSSQNWGSDTVTGKLLINLFTLVYILFFSIIIWYFKSEGLVTVWQDNKSFVSEKVWNSSSNVKEHPTFFKKSLINCLKDFPFKKNLSLLEFLSYFRNVKTLLQIISFFHADSLDVLCIMVL